MAFSISTVMVVLVFTIVSSNASLLGNVVGIVSNIVKKATCEGTLRANQFRCLPPNATQLETPLGVSCQQDCVCVHGLTNGECVLENDGSGIKNCLCYDDASLSATDLANLRNEICAPLIQAFATQGAVKGLCVTSPLPWEGPAGQVPSCNSDCLCGHKAPGGGRCKVNGLVVEGKSYDICHCRY